jgi:hypothetical protein
VDLPSNVKLGNNMIFSSIEGKPSMDTSDIELRVDDIPPPQIRAKS